MESLSNYIIWYNCYNSIYYAIERDSYLKFFNGSRQEAIYHQSKSIDILIDIITKNIVV